MSLIGPDFESILDSARALYTPADGGDRWWLAGDEYRILASREDGAGTIGFVDGKIPVGAGPRPHVHRRTDETFFVISGTIAYLLGGDKTVTAEAGALIHVPRGTLHRFMNVGSEDARLLFLFNPAGPELLFRYGGDIARPGEVPPPWPPERTVQAMAKIAELGLDVDTEPHRELDHLFQPEGGRPDVSEN